MAMTDYPYHTNFLEQMPAYPVNASCKILQNVTQNSGEENLFEHIRQVAEVYYNWNTHTGQSCYDI